MGDKCTVKVVNDVPSEWGHLKQKKVAENKRTFAGGWQQQNCIPNFLK